MVIIGKVIRIPDKYSVIINVGRKAGVSIGMPFVIYEVGEPIIAPDGKDLGKLEYVKARVRVTQVQDNFSIAETQRTDKVTTVSGAIYNSLTWRETLPVSETDIEPFRSLEKKIKVGDLAKEIEVRE